jgi:hypothetical protein
MIPILICIAAFYESIVYNNLKLHGIALEEAFMGVSF